MSLNIFDFHSEENDYCCHLNSEHLLLYFSVDRKLEINVKEMALLLHNANYCMKNQTGNKSPFFLIISMIVVS